MALSFLSLPIEVRLNVYHYVFVPTLAFLEAGMQNPMPSLIAVKTKVQTLDPCSGQVLRVCRQIKAEAEPMLYTRTHFTVLTQAFAGQLPSNFANGLPFAPKVRHLTWQLQCDLMKHFYYDDFVVSSTDVAQLDTLELRIQAESWKGSFCGEWTDRQAFVRGRDQMICYARRLQDMMNEGCARKAFLIENRVGIGRGRVVLRLTRKKHKLSEHVSSLNLVLKEPAIDINRNST